MKTILIIEDNQDIRENIAEILTMSGYKVLTAGNGKEGVSSAIEHRPDLIICDIMMPMLDGYGVIHMLQKHDHTGNIPFIFLTAKAERAEIRKGMELGADDYITKPFDGTELLNAVEARLKKADVVKKEIASGIKGLSELMEANDGKDMLKSFTEDRDTLSFRKKQVIYAEGSHPYRMYYVLTGKVKVYRSNEDGKELVTALYNTGDFFGFVALLEGTSYKEHAEALEDTELAAIPKEDFDRLINNNRHIMQKFIQILANNISEKEQQLLNIAYNSLRKKVADALLSLHRKYGAGKENFSIDISRDNLASIAGTAKESVIRTLSDFKDEKLIDIRQGEIYILNEPRLAGLLN